jgi:hypothetical protein
MNPAYGPGAPTFYVTSGIPPHNTEPPRPARPTPGAPAPAAPVQPGANLLRVSNAEWAERYAQSLQAFSRLRQTVEAFPADKRLLVSLRLRTLNERQSEIDALINTRPRSADDIRRLGISLMEQSQQVGSLDALLSNGWSPELATLLQRSERLATTQLFLEQLSDPPPLDAIRHLPELCSSAYEARSLAVLDLRLQSWSGFLNRILGLLAASGAWASRSPTPESPGSPAPASGVATAAALSAIRRPHS